MAACSSCWRRRLEIWATNSASLGEVGNKQQTWRHQDVKSCWKAHVVVVVVVSRGEYVEADIMDPMSRFCQEVIRLWTVSSTLWNLLEAKNRDFPIRLSRYSRYLGFVNFIVFSRICLMHIPKSEDRVSEYHSKIVKIHSKHVSRCSSSGPHQAQKPMIFGDDSNMGPKKALLSHFFWREVPC